MYTKNRVKQLWELFVARCLKHGEPNLKLTSRFRIWPLGTLYEDANGQLWTYVKKIN